MLGPAAMQTAKEPSVVGYVGDEGGGVAAALDFGAWVLDVAVDFVVEGWRGWRAGLSFTCY